MAITGFSLASDAALQLGEGDAGDLAAAVILPTRIEERPIRGVDGRAVIDGVAPQLICQFQLPAPGALLEFGKSGERHGPVSAGAERRVNVRSEIGACYESSLSLQWVLASFATAKDSFDAWIRLTLGEWHSGRQRIRKHPTEV